MEYAKLVILFYKINMLIKFMEQLNVKIIKFLFRMKIVNMEYGKWLILKKLIIKALIK